MPLKSRQLQLVTGTAGAIMLALFAGACSTNELPSEARANRIEVPEAPLYSAGTTNGPRKIALLDDCLIGDPWPGGCSLPGGTVSFAQFSAELPRGHAAWRNEPSYMKIKAGKDVKIANDGGRTHTLTEVAAYGGGIVPNANWPGVTVAPECLNAATRNASLLLPGQSMDLDDMEAGTHKYQCCFHPWMIAEIRVD